MRMRGIAVAGAAALALAGAAGQAAERSAGSAPVTIVGPLENGAVKISGTASVNGTVAATQSGAWSVGQAGPWSVAQSGSWLVGQSGPWSVAQAGAWSVGLEGPASTALLNIDAATAGLRYDADGNLKVNVSGGGSAADPSVADRMPFGFSAHSTFSDSVTIPGPLTNVTSYSFHSNRDMIAIFMRGSGAAFGLRVTGGQSLVGSFHHAIPADTLQLQCVGGGECTALISAAGY